MTEIYGVISTEDIRSICYSPGRDIEDRYIPNSSFEQELRDFRRENQEDLFWEEKGFEKSLVYCLRGNLSLN